MHGPVFWQDAVLTELLSLYVIGRYSRSSAKEYSELCSGNSTLKHGEAFWMPKDGLKESEKNCDICIWAVAGGQESVCEHERGFLGHLECGRWFQGRRGGGEHGEYLNDEGTLDVESPYVATPPALIAVDLHPIVCLNISSFTLVAAAMEEGTYFMWPSIAFFQRAFSTSSHLVDGQPSVIMGLPSWGSPESARIFDSRKETSR